MAFETKIYAMLERLDSLEPEHTFAHSLFGAGVACICEEALAHGVTEQKVEEVLYDCAWDYWKLFNSERVTDQIRGAIYPPN